MGLAYTELISHPHSLPHRFPTLEADGTIRVLDVICLPHHESFDRSSANGETLEVEAADAIARGARKGAFVQVLNHPDINLDQLFAVLARRREHGRADWTAGRVVDWWRASHLSDVASLSANDDTVIARFGAGAEGALVELLRPDGTVLVRPVSAPPEMVTPEGDPDTGTRGERQPEPAQRDRTEQSEADRSPYKGRRRG